MRSRVRPLVLGLALAAMACEATGPRLAPLSLNLIRADGSGSAAIEFWASPAVATFVVPTSSVASLNVVVTSVDALPRGGNDEEDGAWVSLDVTANGTIDLLALPGDAGTALALAAGTVPVGAYSNVRLFFSDATITFNTDVTLAGNTFEAGVAYPVRFPSGSETGIKTRAGFEVPDGGGAVLLQFDAATAFSHVTVTGSGELIVPPVLTLRPS